MFEYALYHDMCDNNPALGATKYLRKQPEGCHHKALSHQDVPEFVAQLRQYQATAQQYDNRCNPDRRLEIAAARGDVKSYAEIAGEFGISTAAVWHYLKKRGANSFHLNYSKIKAFVVEFLLLIGTPRTSEILGIQWKYIDEANQLLVIPRPRMKTKTGADHIIPLTARPMAIIEEMKAIRSNEYLFPGRGRMKPPEQLKWGREPADDPDATGTPLSHGTLRPFINKELNRQDITIHGLRGTFKNWATHRGYPDIVVEFCLDHKYGTQIENVYRSEPLVDERRRLLQAWSDYCDGHQADFIRLPPPSTRTA
jgi:integrase